MKIRSVRGMNDLLPEVSSVWRHIEQKAIARFASYGYQEIRLPILERKELFERQLGQETEVVMKQMYSFQDAGGEVLTMRPEATVSTVRALLQHGLLHQGAQRVFYMGPMFRHERPQKGRYRQFHQMGAEAIGYDSAEIDAELITICARLWEDLGISDNVSLDINNLGSLGERAKYKEKLSCYFERYRNDLDDSECARILDNPLRILDSKRSRTREIVAEAPRLSEILGVDSINFFDLVKKRLEDAGIKFKENPALVRGLDYYNLTVFEWLGDLEASQNAICGGGRYDGLAEQIGGKFVPGCGFAIGFERLMALLSKINLDDMMKPDVYLVSTVGAEVSRYATVVGEDLRSYGLNVIRDLSGKTLKSQMKRADASGACFAVIVGDEEILDSSVVFKHLREKKEQARVLRTDLKDYLAHISPNVKN